MLGNLRNDLKVMKSAPIAIFAFRRLDLLKQTLRALEACHGFGASPLVVFSDAARAGIPGEAGQVEKLRVWLRAWCATQGAELVEAPVNLGLRASITAGVSQVVERSGRVIVVEDDIVVSPWFLNYMNSALEAGEQHPSVYQVSGYFVPHRRALPTLGLLRVPTCWGWGTWRRAWRCYDDDAAALLAKIRQCDTHAFDLNGSYNHLEALQRNVEGTMNTWYVRWYASVYLKRGLTVYPATSMTRNIGYRGDGTNCGRGVMSKIYLRQRIAARPLEVDSAALGLQQDPAFVATLEEFNRWQHRRWTLSPWQVRVRGKLRRLLQR